MSFLFLKWGIWIYNLLHTIPPNIRKQSLGILSISVVDSQSMCVCQATDSYLHTL